MALVNAGSLYIDHSILTGDSNVQQLEYGTYTQDCYGDPLWLTTISSDHAKGLFKVKKIPKIQKEFG